ncbi:hypothetical protein NE865_02114 [Phthorimaea operculella]|nr:hypothetical protein NE865_02114 [Phthorimaea operculella]
MGESEVVEHLSKMYEQPKSFTAPIPIVAGPFHAKNTDDKIRTLTSESKLIPVVENQEGKEDPIDGFVNEDYRNILEGYAAGHGNTESNLNSFSKSLEKNDDENDTTESFEEQSLPQDLDGGDDSAKKDYKNEKLYNTENVGDYHSAKYESYRVSEGNGEKGDHLLVGHKKNFKGFNENNNYNFQPDKFSEGKAIDEFYKYFNSNEFPKDQAFYDRQAYTGEFNDKFYEEQKPKQSDENTFDDNLYHSGNTGFRDSYFHDKESNSKHREDNKPSQQYIGEDSFRLREHDGGSYSYNIEH